VSATVETTTKTKIDLSERVAAGATLLDRERPGWWNEIDLDRLDLDDCRRCTLGQIYGASDEGYSGFGYGMGLRRLNLTFLDDDDDSEPPPIAPALYGFTIDTREYRGAAAAEADAWERLDDLWTHEVVARRMTTKGERL
jgi:hypothetical protein